MATITTPEATTTPGATATIPDGLPVPPERLHRFTVDDYERMAQAGILSRKHRVILWKGLIVTKMTKHRPHVVVVLRLTDALRPLVAGVGYLEPEQPVRLLRRNDTVPEPDLKVVRGRLKDYTKTPTTADVPLVIEVADSSVAEDRRESIPLYAAEAVPYCWLANIPRRCIEVYSQKPNPGPIPEYGAPVIHERGQSVPVVIDGAEVGRVAVSEIFQDDDPWLSPAT